jgi:nucleotide-binding universal stress UspA family protein
MILISYDGSADAQAAIDRAAELLPNAEATVLTVWEPFVDVLVRTSFGDGMAMAGTFADAEEIDSVSSAQALATAVAGARRATAAGLAAQPRSESRSGDVANTILAVASELDADIIVMGTRGLAGIKSFLLGSVSHHVAQHADRPVLVVPSVALAERRRELTAQTPEPA